MEKNADYTIRQSVLFDNNRGFALGECPMAPAPFVTWQFAEENGKRDYFWGHYYAEAATAVRDFTARAEDYVRRYKVREVEQPEPELYKYYSTQRPIDIGTFPKIFYDEPRHFKNYDERRPVEGEVFLVWGELVYTRPLTEVEVRNYELRPSRDNPDICREAAVKRPIAEQLKDAAKMAEEKRGQTAPKKPVPDRGDR